MLTALSLSGLYRGLHMAHADASRYFAALPLRPACLRFADIVLVATLGLPFLVLPPAALLAHRHAAPASIAAAASSLALLCVLRATQLFSQRHSVVLSSLVAGTWGVLTMASIH